MPPSLLAPRGTRRGHALLCAAWLALPVVAGAAAGAASDAAADANAPAEIQLNQLGYLPGAAKWAAVPVAAGAAPARAFQVLRAGGGPPVLRGRLGPPAPWPEAGQTLALADFSALRRPGRYRLQVDGLPPSAPFVIDPQAHQPLTAAALKAFYFNRAGMALAPAHAGAWARPAGHADTEVRIHASAASAGRPEGSTISAPRGWYDAGDYNKYIVNSGITMWSLLAAWEHVPQALRGLRTGIPESGNGLPDILNEALWNLDWMRAMQDPADGGVYHKLTNLSFDGVVMPHQAGAPRYVVAKSTAAALNFAATAAMASRVLRPYAAKWPVAKLAQRPAADPTQLLAAARAAWAWAQAHPGHIYRQPADVHTGDYGDDQLSDEFAWAAAELFISTGEPGFWQAFVQATRGGQAALAVPSWNQVAALGWISLAQHRAGLPAPADRALIEQRVGALATQLAAQWQASPQRLGTRADDWHWGSASGLLNRAIVLIQGWRLGGPRSQLDAAQAQLDLVLGRNAQASSWVTGLGTRSPQHPHHRPSGADGVVAPVPGFLIGGPNAGRQDAKDCPLPYPSALPARAWLDHFCSYASNEVAINWNAPLVYVSAALQSLTPPPVPPLPPPPPRSQAGAAGGAVSGAATGAAR
ncbi:glycoside hydrolase family 9 protein [Aquabacterium sp. OR-4]|uniref:glycoside hydrolase family 9 protein n=1 Tax=Aquabacterium sp. OR-4 TaxID=2978127 RepID=UPI0028C67896|nr:glycoside hydrolase family 9 protein [Aquabacterium sp. OR-4]MDT7838364.1 glycoside hydrolase family 9 protein [Aquabacterium sp. OR-4]